MKCNNCGAEVAEGMRFCGDCGTPVPQEKKCISCGATIALRMKFCPECGAPQSGEAAKPKFNAAAFAMGDKNVIAGDVIGSQETTHVSGNATIIKNEDQSRQVKRCHICGSLVLITEGFDCPECGQFTCGKCYDADQNCCNDCAKTHSKSKENQYEAALKAALTDGKIDLEERRTLNELAAKLGLNSQQASQIERQVKGEDTAGSMTTAEQLELDSARKLFYASEGDLSSLLSTAQKIYNTYPTNEKALSLYLPVLAASGRSDEALKVINGLGADVFSAYITALDIYLTTGNMSETERYLKKAAMLWPESNTLKCYQAYYYLAMYKKYSDFSFLEKATAANSALKNVSGELELSHQIRLISLLQKEAGEEVPPYDRDFCKENGLYFRIVANQNLSGVYVEGAASAASVNVPASNDEWDEEVYATHILRRQFEGDIDNQIIMSESEIQKFINLYGVDTGDEDYPDEWFSLSLVTDVPENNDGCVDVFQIEGAGLDLKKVLSGKIPFGTHTNPPITVYRKMAADGLNFKVSWYSNNWGEVGRGRGEAKNGKFWHCMDFQATYEDLIGNEEEFDIGAYLNYVNHIDEYGNRCENDTTRVIVYGDKSSKVDILALPVKQILEKKISNLDWDGYIWKFPDYYSTHDSEEDMEMDEYNEYLRASAFEIDGIPAGYLLDKNGNKILSVKDFDHSVPDEDGNIYYPVRRDELVNDNICTLTPEAEAKWRKKLGL